MSEATSGQGDQTPEDQAAKNPASGNQAGGQGGLGPEGTIPNSKDGIGSTVSDEPSEFEPEEDPDAAGTADGTEPGK